MTNQESSPMGGTVQGGRAEKGTAVVESTLIVVAFLLLLVGLIDVGRGVWAYNSLSAAATDAARYAIVHGDRSDAPAPAGFMSNYVKNKLPGLTGLTVNTIWDPDNAQGSKVQVTVAYPY